MNAPLDPTSGPALPTRQRPLDGASLLTVYLVLLLAIPSVMVIAPLGSAGAPSTLVAVGLFLCWVWFWVNRSSGVGTVAPSVVRAALVWLLIMIVVYAHAMASPIAFDEISPADFGMLKLIGLTGVVLVASDGLSDAARWRTFIRRMVVAVAVVACLGMIQFVTRDVLVNRIHIPGLTSVTSSELIVRNGHPRPSGTSTHPIEYGVILAMALPLAVQHAVWSPTRRWFYLGVSAVIALDILLSSSRSALVCAFVAMVILIATWPLVTKLKVIVAAVFLGLVVYVLVPGSLGATTNLFTGAGEDPSIGSRTGSYELVGAFFGHSPFLGRGFGTFLPKYWILDNGYLGLLIEGGLVGLLGLVVLILMAARAARLAVRTFSDGFDRRLSQGVLAAIGSGAAGLAFFDTFGFPQSAGCFFLVLGLAGSAYRTALLQQRPGSAETAAASPSPKPAAAAAR